LLPARSPADGALAVSLAANIQADLGDTDDANEELCKELAAATASSHGWRSG
jgi:hypothetical protein